MKRVLWLLLFALAACSTNEVPRDRVLRVSVPGQPANLDSNKAYDAIAGMILMQMHEGLTHHSTKLDVEPALAEKWEFNADYTEIVYTIREDAKWSDGEKITAEDFAYSWRRLLNPDTAAEYAYFLFDIEGAEAYNSGEGTVEQVGIEVLDERRLKVTLARPAAYFPHITTFMVTYPVRKDVVEAHGDNWTEPGNIVVSGPFVPVEHLHEYRLALAPNPHWPLGKQKVDRLEIYMTAEKTTALNLFVSGHMDIVLDMLPIAIPSYKNDPDYFNGSKLEVRYIGFRLDHPGVQDPRVRTALAKSIKREEFPAVLKGGEIPTKVWLPNGMFGHSPETGIDYDPEGARKLMAEAGYEGGNGFPKLLLLFRAGDDWRLVAENLQQQWKRELGIEIEIQVREQKVFFREIDGEAPPPMHLARWIADFPDPENFMGLFKSNSGNNSLKFASDPYDAMVNEAVQTDDATRRQKLYADAQKILVVDDVAMIPIYTAAQNVLRRENLVDLEFNAMGDARLGEVGWK